MRFRKPRGIWVALVGKFDTVGLSIEQSVPFVTRVGGWRPRSPATRTVVIGESFTTPGCSERVGRETPSRSETIGNISGAGQDRTRFPRGVSAIRTNDDGTHGEQPMYERFTDRARKVMQLANQEAQRFNHEYIGTEHILLGLVKEGSGVAANVLKNLDVDLRKIRLEVEKIVQHGPDIVSMGKLPQTPRAKKVIEYSMEEARNLNHNYVGPNTSCSACCASKRGSPPRC